MAEIKEIMNANKLQPLIDITPTKNISPDHDVESLIIDIPEELEPDLDTTCWIYRVPIKLRQVNEAAYTPQLVSIGPFHYGKPQFKSMEGHKSKYRQQFWKRDFCKHIDEKNVVEAFMKHGGRIERILRCYASTLEVANKDRVDHWAKVILTDACFIFELMLRNYESRMKGESEPKDYILRTPWLKKGIEVDLMLLENQLPFFVFTELFDFILDSQPDKIILHHTIPHLSKWQNESERRFSLLKVVIEFFRNYYLIGKPVDEKSNSPTPRTHHSITATGLKRSTLAGMTRFDPAQTPPTEDLVSDLREPLITMKQDQVPNPGSHHVRKEKCVPETRMSESPLSNAVLPSPSPGGCPSSESERKDMERFVTSKHFTDLVRKFLCPENYEQTLQLNSCSYSAKKLDRAGVKFEPCTNAHLADIVYEKSSMSLKVKVPKFTVQDDTECLVRNVMALEQCLYPLKPHICNYVALLDQLIDTAEDVELLIEKEIARNLLGSNEAVAKLVNKLCDQIVVQTSCYVKLCEELNHNYNNWWSVSKETFKRVYFKDLWTGSSTIVGFFVTLFSVVSVISTIKGLISG